LDAPHQTWRRRRRTTTLATAVTITNQVPKILQSTIKTPTAAILSKSIGNQQSSRTHHKTNSSTINPIYEYSEEINAAAERDFNDRRDHAADVCQRRKILNKYPPNAWEFFVSQGHGLAWCSVFKAASSTWLYYFNLLGGYSANYLQKTHTPPLELARKRFPRPNQYELNEVLAASISFLVVRDPFERLVSAYRNKLEGDRNKYYKLLGQQIVKKFRRKHKKRTKSSGPSFREFIQFIVQHHKSGGRLDEHFSPIYTFCSVCSINFTLIAKMETFQRDTDYIIRQAGLDSLLLNKLPKKHRLQTIQNRAKSDTKEVTPRYNRI
jgi:chondroitin 4-sulfotransferase 11